MTGGFGVLPNLRSLNVVRGHHVLEGSFGPVGKSTSTVSTGTNVVIHVPDNRIWDDRFVTLTPGTTSFGFLEGGDTDLVLAADTLGHPV